MADEPELTVNGAPSTESAAPPASSVATEAPAPAVAESAAPPAEAPKTAAAPETPKTVAETPSLLEEVKAPGSEEPPKTEEPKVEAKTEEPKTEAKPEEKPAEAPKEGEKPAEAKTEEAPVEKPPLAPVEYKYELPETVKLPDELKTEFHGVLDGLRADPSNVQPLIDFHIKAMTGFEKAVSQRQHDVFNTTRTQWQDQIKSDEEMGGSGFETTKSTVARMRDKLVSSAKPGSERYQKEMQEAQQFFRVTGGGDHPVLWRILHNAARWLDEPTPPPAEIKPAPQGRAPGDRRSLLYNNPTSPNNRNG